MRWALTPPGRRLLTEGTQRIYGFGSGERVWDGTWLVVLVSVPESKRDLRHRVPTRLSWAGFGSPEPGVRITPRTDREAEVLGVLKELGPADGAMSFTANYGAVGSEAAMVARAWDLSEVSARYEAFVHEFSGLRPADGDAVPHDLTRLVHEWRRFPFLDPRLPSKLLPMGWSGARATELFHRRHAEWSPRAQRRWEELGGQSLRGWCGDVSSFVCGAVVAGSAPRRSRKWTQPRAPEG